MDIRNMKSKNTSPRPWSIPLLRTSPNITNIKNRRLAIHRPTMSMFHPGLETKNRKTQAHPKILPQRNRNPSNRLISAWWILKSSNEKKTWPNLKEKKNDLYIYKSIFYQLFYI